MMATNAAPGSSQEAVAHTVSLGLGSNLGDRDGLLRAAVERLREVVAVTRVSSIYDTAPLLLTDQPRFHNAVLAGTTALEPMGLLRAAQAIERELGRVPSVRYGPRSIDIDLLFYDDLDLHDLHGADELTLPHPRIAERAFVLAPLAEIAPGRALPVLGTTPEVLLSALGAADVRRLGPLFPQGG
jgi:2-amino-4-hydroxy-6-hydroxymethyldihydropteridine diphosphokinase